MSRSIQYCDSCIQEATRVYQRVNTSEGSIIVEPTTLCASCLKSWKEYIAYLRRDAAYRSHISRQLAGIPCDAKSECPHHTASEPSYTWDDQNEISNAQRLLILEAWKEVKRTSFNKITAMELLGGHHLGFVRYCNSCYEYAISNNFTINDKLFYSPEEVEICSGCREQREAFIERFHGHQNTFNEPWERGHLDIRASEVLKNTEWDYDDYMTLFHSRLLGGGSWNTGYTIAVAFGGATLLVGSASLMVTLVKEHREWHERHEKRDLEAGEMEPSVELGAMPRAPEAVHPAPPTPADAPDEAASYISDLSFHTARGSI